MQLNRYLLLQQLKTLAFLNFQLVFSDQAERLFFIAPIADLCLFYYCVVDLLMILTLNMISH